MINKLKIKFVCLTMVALTFLMACIITGMNLVNYNSIVVDADITLEFLSQNNGKFPPMLNDKANITFPEHMSPETPYESRYFSVLLNKDGKLMQTETSKIVSVTPEMAEKYALMALEESDEKGFIDNFRYIIAHDGQNTHITFLDCGRKLDSFKTFLLTSIGMSLAGIIIVFIIIMFFAGRIIRPLAESYKKQKRFITDAGHEIKTPLTIISANIDLLADDPHDTECLDEIRKQTERLTTLTNDLVSLARIEEYNETAEKTDIPISDIILDCVKPFKGLADSQGKSFEYNIQPNITFYGNQKSIEKLVLIIVDNAIKYTPTDGTIKLDLSKQGHSIKLHIFNTTDAVITSENLKYVFDRFYRTDSSRNSSTGGHGIGLSIAKAIVTSYGGKISAWSDTPDTFNITIIL